jgi:NitT/TauT family transport system substrate-binding protein
MSPGFCRAALVAAATTLGLVSGGSAQAETVKVGLSKLVSYPAVPIAIARGYFKDVGIDAQMVFFDSAQPIAVGVTSGDVDFGVSGLSAGFYTLAAQGQLRLLASSAGEEPGFYNIVFLVSNKAYDAGLKTIKDLPGHDVAVTQLGTSLQYTVGLAAEKYGFPIGSVAIKPLQSNSNVISALIGGTVATGVLPGTPTLAVVQKGDVKRLGWAGDLVPGWMGSALFTNTKHANNQGDLVKRFMTAYRKGTQDYHDAFATPDDKRKDGPDAPAMLKLLADFSGAPAEEIDKATPYIDAQGKVNVGDVANQISWYKSQNQLKGDVKADELVDMRYAIPVATH